MRSLWSLYDLVFFHNNKFGANFSKWSSGCQCRWSHQWTIMSFSSGINIIIVKVQFIKFMIFLQGPYRHYILNVLWIMINMLCMLLIIKQLHRLHKEFSHKNVKVKHCHCSFICWVKTYKECILQVSSVKSGYNSDGRARLVSYLASRVGKEGASKVRIFFAISFSYILFWGPLFTVTLVNWNWEWKDAKNSLSHEVRFSLILQA